MTFEHTPEERKLAREIRGLQRDRAYYLAKVQDKDAEIAELKEILKARLEARGINAGA